MPRVVSRVGNTRHVCPAAGCPTTCQQPPSSNQNSAWANDAEIGCCRPAPPRSHRFLIAGTMGELMSHGGVASCTGMDASAQPTQLTSHLVEEDSGAY